MKNRIVSEAKIFGVNFFLVSAFLTLAVLALSVLGGDLLDFYPTAFEVVFPLFAAIAAGEWGKTRADGNFDCIAAQSRSLFGWVFLRYAAAFGILNDLYTIQKLYSFTLGSG